MQSRGEQADPENAMRKTMTPEKAKTIKEALDAIIARVALPSPYYEMAREAQSLLEGEDREAEMGSEVNASGCLCRKALKIQRKEWWGVTDREDGAIVELAEAQIRQIDAALASPCCSQKAERAEGGR